MYTKSKEYSCFVLVCPREADDTIVTHHNEGKNDGAGGVGWTSHFDDRRTGAVRCESPEGSPLGDRRIQNLLQDDHRPNENGRAIPGKDIHCKYVQARVNPVVSCYISEYVQIAVVPEGPHPFLPSNLVELSRQPGGTWVSEKS